MKLIQLLTFVILSSSFAAVRSQVSIPFGNKRWTTQAQGSLVEFHKGYNSLYLQNGTAVLKDEKVGNGIIEFDMYQSERPSFSGVIFRVKDTINYEEIYLRSHQSGNPDAFQYTPVFNNDPAWQLYHDAHDAVNDGFVHWKQRSKIMGYNTVVNYAFDRWTHVKLILKGKEAELYIDDMSKPVAFIRELLTGTAEGSLGVKSGNGATWFANFSYIKNDNIEFKTKPDSYKQTIANGTIQNWQVSNAIKEEVTAKMDKLDMRWLNGLQWNSLLTESSGLANLSRLSAVSDSGNTVLVKCTVNAESDLLKKLDFGYSDRVKLYHNGQVLFAGNTGFRTRDYRYLGTIGYFEAVYLPLKKGENTIIFAVSETFGGWGLMAKWEDPKGIRMQ